VALGEMSWNEEESTRLAEDFSCLTYPSPPLALSGAYKIQFDSKEFLLITVKGGTCNYGNGNFSTLATYSTIFGGMKF